MSVIEELEAEFSRQHGPFFISTARERLDMARVQDWICRQSYWGQGMSRDLLARAVRNSLPIGAYAADGAQVGFARVVTDASLFAYLRDVFVDETARGQGLATAMTRFALDHPRLATVQNWMLATKDAHAVYARAGFRPLATPDWYMQILRTSES